MSHPKGSRSVGGSRPKGSPRQLDDELSEDRRRRKVEADQHAELQRRRAMRRHPSYPGWVPRPVAPPE